MKKGYKHRTGVFGTDSERYASRLFMMQKNPNGSRRPDLISVNGRFNPRLSIEMKSGRKQKGVMVDYQLHYSVTTEDDYEELVQEKIPDREGLLNSDWTSLPTGEVAYYYCLLNRTDTVTSADLDKPFSSIQMNWGDMYMVPHQFGFCAFAVSRARRTGEKLEDVVKDLRRIIKRDILEGSSHYEERKGDRNSWQDLHGRGILAIFHDDDSIATREGKERVRAIRNIYPSIDNDLSLDEMERIKITGPNGTTIYVLGEPVHKELLDVQFRRTVAERNPILERVDRARKRALPLLKKIKYEADPELFDVGNLADGERIKMDLSGTEIKRLDRLTHWLNYGEREIEPQVKQAKPVPLGEVPF